MLRTSKVTKTPFIVACWGNAEYASAMLNSRPGQLQHYCNSGISVIGNKLLYIRTGRTIVKANE